MENMDSTKDKRFEQNQDADKNTIRIISTSDIHGKMLAYDYALDVADTSGSLAQVSSAIKEYRNDNTILVDVGDTIQDNFADLFQNEEIHPMALGMNAIGYDICTTGNHEYNFGMDTVKRYINAVEAKVLLGNVWDENGKALADAYTIYEINGCRIAFIGMVTQNIAKWDKANLDGYQIKNPADETNKIIDEIENDVKNKKIEPVDLYVGVFHMMRNDEYDVENSGFESMAKACPRLNVILGSHGHVLENGICDNDIYVTENLANGKSIQIIDITFDDLSKAKPAKIIDISSKAVETASYPEDEKIKKLLLPYDKQAKEYARTKVGTLVGSALAPEEEIKGINPMFVEDTALQSLIQEAMCYYAKADVAISAPCTGSENMLPGDLTIANICRIYKFANMLDSVKMSGDQLKTYLEWTASFYQQYEKGDLTIAFEDKPVYLFDTATGVNFDIDISEPVGSRIKNLSYPDKTPISDDDTFVVAVCNYRYNTSISVPGVIFEKDNMPELIDSDIRGDLGDVRFLLIDYIKNVKGGIINSECNVNWRIIGNDWDENQHKKAVELINNGTIPLVEGQKGNPSVKKVTVEDIAKY